MPLLPPPLLLLLRLDSLVGDARPEGLSITSSVDTSVVTWSRVGLTADPHSRQMQWLLPEHSDLAAQGPHQVSPLWLVGLLLVTELLVQAGPCSCLSSQSGHAESASTQYHRARWLCMENHLPLYFR